MPGEELNETVQMVYVGDTETRDKKVWQQFIEIAADQNNGDPMPKKAETRLYERLMKSGIVGGIYEFKGRHDEEGRLTVTKGGRFVGQWKNPEDRSQWQLEHKLVQIAKQARREFLPDEIMEPIREAYQRTPHFQRQAFLAWLFQAIQRTKR